MSKFKSVSADEVIGRIIRNTRIQDSSYIDDIFDWVSEAVHKMQSEHVLIPKRAKVQVCFHKIELPKDLESLEAVVSNGSRLMYGGPGMADTKTHVPSRYTAQTIIMAARPHDLPNEDFPYDIDTVVQYPDTMTFQVAYDGMECSTEQWYTKSSNNHLNCSIEDGWVYIYYWAYDKDCNGIIMIPDNEDFKEAIYWYVRMKLIESGWQDPVFQYGDVRASWNEYGPRGANAVAFTTPDEQAKITRNLIRMVVPDNWANNFGVLPPEQYDV